MSEFGLPLLPTFPFFVTCLGGDAVAIGLATALFSLASIVSRRSIRLVAAKIRLLLPWLTWSRLPARPVRWW